MRPQITPRGEEKQYFDALQAGALTFGECVDCERPHFYPRTICPHCNSENIQILEGSGRGEIYTFTTQYRAGHPSLNFSVPYTLVVVEMNEGYRMMADLLGVEPQAVQIGSRVVAEIERPAGEYPIVHFRLEEANDA